MKLLHTGDLHIGMTNYSKLDPETGLESRLLDFFNTLDFIVDLAISENVDVFLFAGDAYKTRDPSPTQQRGFGERIKRVAKAGIPVVMVVGNHDTPNAEGKANTLDIYSALEIEGVWVSRKPELLNIPTKSGNLQVITVPWLQKEEYKKIGDKLLSLYGHIKIGEKNGPAVLVGHAEVEGSSFGSEKGLTLSNNTTIPLSLLTEKKLSYAALGHIHKHQTLKENPLIVYSGSPERIDFGEAKEEKGVVLVEILESQEPRVKSQEENIKPRLSTLVASHFSTSYNFIPTPARKFIAISVSLKADDENPTQAILDEIGKHNISDAVVKVVLDIPANLNREIEMDKIKKALSSAFYIASISKNVEKKERQILEGEESVESLTPIEALQKYFESKKYSPEKIKELEKHATQLIE